MFKNSGPVPQFFFCFLTDKTIPPAFSHKSHFSQLSPFCKCEAIKISYLHVSPRKGLLVQFMLTWSHWPIFSFRFNTSSRSCCMTPLFTFFPKIYSFDWHLLNFTLVILDHLSDFSRLFSVLSPSSKILEAHQIVVLIDTSFFSYIPSYLYYISCCFLILT